MRVFISAHCRNPDLFDATKFVFKTLRVGFPNSEIIVYDNALSQLHRSEIQELCRKNTCKFQHIPQAVSYGGLIWQIFSSILASDQDEPFWLCDTDIVFWDSMEQFEFETAMAGRHIPKFFDTYTKCITMPRLHTSLLYIDPAKVRREMDMLLENFPRETPHNPMVNPVFPFFMPSPEGKDEYFFYDLCAPMSYMLSQTRFTEKHLDCFDHANCGTFADLLEPHGHEGMVARQKAMFANPETMRGLWKEQDKYFAYHAVK
jgi:hypothetical protein